MQYCTVNTCKNKSYRHYELCQKHTKDGFLNKFSRYYKRHQRKSIIKNDVAHIPLGGKRGGVAIVDKEYAWLDQYLWCMGTHGYVATYINGKCTLMHHVVNTKPKTGLVTDHINRNKLDNRLANLRIVSQSINAQNIGKSVNNNSGYNGVSWSKANNKWESYITYNRKRKHLGLFSNLEDAVNARKVAELKYWS
jgi:hypothetical protein